MENCIFCKIVAGEIPSYTIYEDDDFKAIFDISPYGLGHTLVIAKGYYANIFEMPEELVGKGMQVAQKVAVAIQENLSIDGLNVLQNNGAPAGQSVMHFHIHVIPHYEGMGQMEMNKLAVSKEEMEEAAEKLAAVLK